MNAGCFAPIIRPAISNPSTACARATDVTRPSAATSGTKVILLSNISAKVAIGAPSGAVTGDRLQTVKTGSSMLISLAADIQRRKSPSVRTPSRRPDGATQSTKPRLFLEICDRAADTGTSLGTTNFEILRSMFIALDRFHYCASQGEILDRVDVNAFCAGHGECCNFAAKPAFIAHKHIGAGYIDGPIFFIEALGGRHILAAGPFLHVITWLGVLRVFPEKRMNLARRNQAVGAILLQERDCCINAAWQADGRGGLEQDDEIRPVAAFAELFQCMKHRGFGISGIG